MNGWICQCRATPDAARHMAVIGKEPGRGGGDVKHRAFSDESASATFDGPWPSTRLTLHRGHADTSRWVFATPGPTLQLEVPKTGVPLGWRMLGIGKAPLFILDPLLPCGGADEKFHDVPLFNECAYPAFWNQLQLSVLRRIPCTARILRDSSWVEYMEVVSMLAWPASSLATSIGTPSTSAWRTKVWRIQCVDA